MGTKINSDIMKVVIAIIVVVVILIIAIIYLGTMISDKKESMQENIVVKTDLTKKPSKNENKTNPINDSSTDGKEQNTTNNISNENSSVNNSQNTENTNTTNSINNNIDNSVNANNASNTSSNTNEPSNSTSGSNSGIDIIAKDKNKASIELKSGTVTGGIIMITDKNRTPYIWGPGYKIQIKQDGNWKDLEPIHEMIFEEIEYTLNENNQYEETIDWSQDYAALAPGNYRIVKWTNYNNSKIEFYTEFVVNE